MTYRLLSPRYPRCSIGAIALALAVPVAAQEASTPLEEIVVTARKRQENLMDVPLAITAFTSVELQRASIDSMLDLSYHTPGLVFDSFVGQQLSVPTVRGISPVNVLTDEVNTSVFVDGVYISGRQGLNFNLLDVERIEVVKGPQSALYGRNSFSGAINVVTRRPGDTLDGKVQLTVGNDGREGVSGTVSGPLIDGLLAGRLGLAFDSFDGSYPNGDGEDFGGHEYNTLSTGLFFTPTENLDLVWNLFYSDDEINPPAVTAVPANCQPSTSSGNNSTYCGEIPATDQDSLSRSPLGEGETRELFRTSLHVSWDLGIGTLSSITGYNTQNHGSSVDYSRDGAPLTYSYRSSLPGPPLRQFNTELIATTTNDVEEITQELRFSSPLDKPLRWSAGVYYYASDTHNTQLLGATDPLPADILIGDFAPAGIFGVPLFGFGGQIAQGMAYWAFFQDGLRSPRLNDKREAESWSVFADMEYDATDRLTLRAELRYSEEEKSLDSTEWRFSTPEQAVVPHTIYLEDNWSFVTGRFTLDYQLSDDSMVYASVANGIKSGGFDRGGLVDSEADAQFDPEENISYELGLKSRFWDGRAQFDGAVYYIDWSEIQLPEFASDNRTRKTVNAGDGRSTGVEISLELALTDALTAMIGGSYTDAEFTEGSSADLQRMPDFAPDGDLKGQNVPRTSATQATASLTYRQDVGQGFEGYLRGDVLYQSKQYIDLSNYGELPSRTLFNLRMGLESETWSVEIWGENLTNEDAPTSAHIDVFLNNVVDGQVVFFQPRVVISHPDLRTYGATVTLRF